MRLRRVQKSARRFLHLREPWDTTRSEPGRSPLGSWRWMLTDRFVPIRWAGGSAPEGTDWPYKAGDIVSYDLANWATVLHTKFPKLYRFSYRLTVHKFKKCECSRRVWSWRGLAIDPRCERHGFAEVALHAARAALAASQPEGAQ